MYGWKLLIQASVISYYHLMKPPRIPYSEHQDLSLPNKQNWIINQINGLFFTKLRQLLNTRKYQNVRLIYTEKSLFPLRKTNDNNPTWWKNYFVILFLIVSILDGLYYYGFKFVNLLFDNVLLDVCPHPICFHLRCHNFQLKRSLLGRLNIYMFLTYFLNTEYSWKHV